MSVQAGETAYSEPRKDRAPAYTKVEVGYPSDVEDRLMPYVEDRHMPLSTVYVCVPMEVVEQVILAHGGMVGGELPPGHRLDLVAPKVFTRRPRWRWARQS